MPDMMRMPMIAVRSAKPFLKWAGGKRQLLPEILKRTPTEINTYYEPFLGGGAVFFELWNQRRFKRAVLSDTNQELIDLYRAVRDNPKEFLACAADIYAKHTEEYYYSLRASVMATSIGGAVRTLYLNKAGFNGLYRVNQKGEFNVPWGKRPTLALDTDAIWRASEALQDADLYAIDFGHVTSAEPGDFVYMDPPYVPTAPTSFAAYQKDGFGLLHTRRVVDVCSVLRALDVAFLASNSDAPDAVGAFAVAETFKVEHITARRTINSNGAGRGKVGEILVSAL
jgi:DNA adenine methylase